MFRTMIFDTVTGDFQLEVEASAASWSTKIDGTGQGSATFQLRGGNLPRGTARNLLLVNAATIAHVDEHGTVVAAGVVQQTTYDREAGAVTAQWVDIRDIFRYRLPFGVLSWGASGSSLAVEDRTYAGAVRAILYRGMGSGEEPAWDLPIVLPPDEGPGDFTRTWKYYDFPLIDDMLSEIEAEGIEIYFDPYLNSAGALRFQTRVARRIALGSIDVPVTTPETRVVGLQVTIDGSRQITGVIYAGTGSEADTKTAGAGHGPYDIPVRDAVRTAKDVKSTAQLQRMANADLEDHFDYLVQRSYGIRLGDPIRAAHVKPGCLLNMDVRGDDWLADLLTTQRVIGISGDLKDTIRVESQSYGG